MILVFVAVLLSNPANISDCDMTIPMMPDNTMNSAGLNGALKEANFLVSIHANVSTIGIYTNLRKLQWKEKKETRITYHK